VVEPVSHLRVHQTGTLGMLALAHAPLAPMQVLHDSESTLVFSAWGLASQVAGVDTQFAV
jgi:hypothetical protein